jgi:hypothetical protein
MQKPQAVRDPLPKPAFFSIFFVAVILLRLKREAPFALSFVVRVPRRMPTKIVLDVSDKQRPPFSSRTLGPFMADEENPQRNRVKETRDRSVPRGHSTRVSSRRIVRFRSSIFRESAEEEEEQERKRGLSTTDIRASPRLVGYFYQLLASTVLLITVVKFYRNSAEDATVFSIDSGLMHVSDRNIFESINGPVYYYKLVGCAVIGSVGAGVCSFIVLAHFDTVCFPRLWVTFFRDGSKWEQNLLRLMLLFWAAGLHVCTSSLSVGEVQGNVYFTTWIAFASACLNYGVWRVSAGLSSLAEKVNLHHRETTYNWLWTLSCLFIFAGAATDNYFNREEVTVRQKGQDVDLSDREWRIILAICWSFVAVSLLALFMNHVSTKSLDFMLCGKFRVMVGWRHIEGLVILLMVGVFFWFIYEHTGVDSSLNGLNNGYFGAWGAFFNSVFLFGTWLRENKNLEYIVGNDKESEREVTFQLHTPTERD